MRRLLVTGGAGFIGSHLVEHLLKKYPEDFIITLDKLTYAGSLDHLSLCLNNPRHQFVQGDICDKPLLDEVFSHAPIHGVFHLAAESHVDNSINGPEPFIQSNIVGTFNLLEAARKHWSGVFKDSSRFLHVSTDEVFGSLDNDGLFTEQSPYQPNSPYSASKASSDMLVRSYFKTYGLNTIVSNCSNNFGPRQHDEKLIPTIVRNALAGKPIPIYGNGKNVRDWLFVRDHCEALDLLFHKGLAGECYNIGTRHELQNIDLAILICDLLDKMHPAKQSYHNLIQFVADRLGHDFRYAIDSTKLLQLGWKESENFENNLQKTLTWFCAKYGITEIETSELY